MDYLRSHELLSSSDDFPGDEPHGAGFIIGSNLITAHLEPSPFAIALYVKSKGYSGAPKDFFDLKCKED